MIIGGAMTTDEASAHLEFRFPALEITQAGGVCPFQAEGTLHGMAFYFRYRHGYAELRIPSRQGWFKPLYCAGAEFGTSEDQGWLDGPEFVEVMSQLIPRLERARIFWEFPGVEPEAIGQIKAGTPRNYGDWGYTPEQAWASMHEPSQYLTGRGFDAETQAQWIAARRMSPVTVTVDNRVFPDPDPFIQEASR